MSLFEVSFAGDAYEYDPDSLTMGEVDAIFAATQLNYRDWLQALKEDRADAARALIYILRRRGDQTATFADVDGPWSSYMIRALKPAPGGDADAGPTSPRRRSTRKASAPAGARAPATAD